MLQPDKRSIYQMFEVQRRYVVPLFQRPYVWNEEDHWEPLWSDIQQQAENVLAGEKRMPHFLGAVVFNQLQRRTRDVDTSEVIDGQQRLTTLQVFLAAFRDLTNQHGIEDLTRDLNEVTRNRRLSGQKNPKSALKFLPTQADQDVFLKVMEGGSLQTIEESIEGGLEVRLVAAYHYFSTQLGTFFGEEGIDENGINERMWAVYDAMRDRLHMVVIDLDEDDDPQIIFETLNARGVPLLPSDLIRNFVLQRAREGGENMEALYNKYWREFDEKQPADIQAEDQRFWKKERRQGRLTRPLIDLYFFHYLHYRRLKEFNVTNLYKVFCEWWRGLEDSPVETKLEDIRLHSDVFAEFFTSNENTRVGLFLHRLDLLDTSTVYPLLLHVLGPRGKKLPDGDAVTIVTDIESYLVRRMLCRLTTKNYNKFFLALLQHLHNAEKPSLALVREFLLSSEDETSRWPKADEMRPIWLDSPVYRRIRGDRVQMVLLAAEAQLFSSRQERVNLSTPTTLEHVMPQEWHKNWPLTVDGRDLVDDSEETHEDRRKRLLQTFGNLTLLTQSLNSAVSNGPYSEKRDKITAQSTLQLNSHFQKAEVWDEGAILERGTVLFDLMCKAWPHPRDN